MAGDELRGATCDVLILDEAPLPDPELEAMRVLHAALLPLDEAARKRAIEWVWARLIKPPPPPPPAAAFMPARGGVLPPFS